MNVYNGAFVRVSGLLKNRAVKPERKGPEVMRWCTKGVTQDVTLFRSFLTAYVKIQFFTFGQLSTGDVLSNAIHLSACRLQSLVVRAQYKCKNSAKFCENDTANSNLKEKLKDPGT